MSNSMEHQVRTYGTGALTCLVIGCLALGLQWMAILGAFASDVAGSLVLQSLLNGQIMYAAGLFIGGAIFSLVALVMGMPVHQTPAGKRLIFAAVFTMLVFVLFGIAMPE